MSINSVKWRWILGYEGLYLVSEDGEIMTMPRGGKDAHVLKLHNVGRGYKQVLLYSADGSSARYLVHRLVATAFCEMRKDATEVNHIDGNKSNNRASNLEWVTKSENMIHSSRVLGGNHRKPTRRRFTDEQVRFIRSSSTGIRPLARQFGVTPTAIRQIKTGKTYQEVE